MILLMVLLMVFLLMVLVMGGNGVVDGVGNGGGGICDGC